MKTLTLVLGIVMLILGGYLALRPLWAHGRPVTGSLLLDMTFAAVFLLRGVMNVRRARRKQGRSATTIQAP